MNKLITMALTHGDLLPLFRVPELLLPEHNKEQLKWIKDYSNRYTSAPTLEDFCKEFPFFIKETSKAPIEAIFDDEVKRLKNIFFIEKSNAASKTINNGGDPSELVKTLADAFTISSSGTLSTKTHSKILSYTEPSETFDFGIQLIDESTGGIAFGDYVLIVGRPGSRKTTFMEYLITQSYFCGHKVLYISNENPAPEVLPKLDSQMAGFNPIRLRKRDWSPEEILKLRVLEHIGRSSNTEIIIPEDPVLTVPEVNSLIETHDPDLIYIDGIYLMQSSSKALGWEDLTLTSRNLKRLARKTERPIIGTIQANRTAEDEFVGRNSVGGTDAFLQDADTLISLNNRGGRTIGKIVKSRWGATPFHLSFEVEFDYESMIISSQSDSSDIVAIEDDDEW